ncbi:TPA: hypothetical protein ACMFP1_002954 [Pseudomonas aeruginosa]
MTILSYTRLCEVVDRGYLSGLEDRSQINAASIDVRLGCTFLVEDAPFDEDYFTEPPLLNVDLAARESVCFREHKGRIRLEPMEFVLAHTVEQFNLPDWLSCEFSLKSSIARNGLEHLNACWVDAGFSNSVLTLELKNMTRHHALVLRPGMLIGQLKFFEHEPVPEEQSYRNRGRYNGDASVSTIKP